MVHVDHDEAFVATMATRAASALAWLGLLLLVGCGNSGSVTVSDTPTDADRDGYSTAVDCDDTNASIHPGAAETCDDGIDQDCSGNDLVCLADTTAPTLSAGQPSGTLPAGTTQTILRVATDEAATCKWSTTLETSYAAMLDSFTTTGGTSHETLVSGFADGQSYTYYIRCQDSAGNVNTADFVVSFRVSTRDTYTIIATAGPNGSISPSGATDVAAGGSQAYTITASSGYQIASLTVDGSPVGVSATYTFANVQADHTINAAFSVATPSSIEAVAAAYAAEPLLSGTVYYYCDCGTGAAPDCEVGDDANSGTAAATPRRTLENAMARLNSIAENETVALCQGGAFDAPRGFNITRSGCTAGTTCVDLREYTPTAFAGTAKPIINHTTAGAALFTFNGDRGGVRFLNLALAGDNADIGNGNNGFFFYDGAHDVTVGNLDMNDFDTSFYNAGGNPGVAPTTNIKLAGSRITGSRRFGFLGAGIDADISYNYWAGCGSSTVFDHAIYLSAAQHVTNMKVIGNLVLGQYTSTCEGAPIVAHLAVDGLIVSGNTVHIDASAARGGCWGMAFNNITGDTDPVYLRNASFSGNTVVNGGNLALTVSNCPDCVIENNLIIQDWPYNGNRGIMVASDYANPQDDENARNTIRNNTVWFGPNTSGSGTGIIIGLEGTGHISSNNTVYSQETSGSFNCFDYPLALTSYAFINNNHCHATGAYSFEATRGTLSAWRTYSQAHGWDSDSIEGIPLLSNATSASGYDFKPDTDSILIGAGSATSMSSIDMVGVPRPNPPSIGAFEP